MAALSGLHNATTPEQKRQREEKQKQYARDLDEQVSFARLRHACYSIAGSSSDQKFDTKQIQQRLA